MGEYINGLSTGTEFGFDMERVKKALDGYLMTGEDIAGLIYEPAPKEECDRFIIEKFESWYFKVKQLADFGRAFERLAKNHHWHYNMFELFELMEEESHRFNDYVYEYELEEVIEEAQGALGGEDGTATA